MKKLISKLLAKIFSKKENSSKSITDNYKLSVKRKLITPKNSLKVIAPSKIKSINDIEIIENMLKIGKFNKMFRINHGGLRLYIQEKPFGYYSGLTGALEAATFSGDKDKKRLKGWREGMIDSFGKKNADNFLNMTADFGTLLHTAAVTIKQEGKIDWNEEKDRAYEYFIMAYKTKHLEPDLRVIKLMVYEYQKHVASMLQFFYERVQEVYAIEVPAKVEHLKIATPIDIYCKCKQTDKGEFKNTTVNIKTSSQIFKHHYEQVAMEFHMWNETYGGAECTGIMRTKNWTEGKKPTFEYKYLDKEEASKLNVNSLKRLELCLMSDASYFPEPTNKSFTGVTEIGEQPEIITKSLEEEWIEVNTEE